MVPRSFYSTLVKGVTASEIRQGGSQQQLGKMYNNFISEVDVPPYFFPVVESVFKS